MINLQNYIMTCQKHILMNAICYQMLIEMKQSPNMSLISYFLKHIIMMTGFKTKNPLIYHQCHHQVVLKILTPKGLKILTPKKLLTRLPIIINANKVKARNNSYKFIQILYLLYQHNKITKKSLQQFNQVITIIEETFCFNFDWPKNVDENLKHEIEFIIKSNGSLAENKIKNEIEKLLLKHKHGSNIHEHRKSKTNELHKFVLNLDLESTGGNIALQNLTFYYTWKNIRKQYKNNKLKTIAPTWNDEFDLPDGFYSVSDI